MEFAYKLKDGHFGPRYVAQRKMGTQSLIENDRKFWHLYMPRLKYHNPAVSMTVKRVDKQDGPALMTIHFTDAESAANTGPAVSSTTQPHTSSAPVSTSISAAPTERTATINMKHRHSTEILSQFMALTKAKALEPTAKDLELAQEVEERKMQTEKDSKQSALVNEARKKKEAMLAQARGEIAQAQTN